MGAQWMAAGFVHGVLNTDNINITGESFDYGPWRWLPTYDPGFTAAYFDYHGLYAYGRQPETLLWNLAQLGSALLTVVDKAVLLPALDAFEAAMHSEYSAATRHRLGLASRGIEQDAALARAFAQALEASQVPFEQAWFDWHGGLGGPRQAAYRHPGFDAVRAALRGYEPARAPHPYFAGERPATLLIDEVEALWAPIAAHDDWSALAQKLAAIGVMAEAYGISSPPSPAPCAAG
jgi:hypothetical protein